MLEREIKLRKALAKCLQLPPECDEYSDLNDVQNYIDVLQRMVQRITDIQDGRGQFP